FSVWLPQYSFLKGMGRSAVTGKRQEARMSSKVSKVILGVVSAILLAGMLSSILIGQVADGNLVGSVLDASGAAVPNAKVEIENIATGVKASTTTDANGFYRFGNLLVGAYKVTANSAGMAPSAREVAIELSKTATANLTLNIGAVSAVVE